MQISRNNNIYNKSFKAANISINAISDTHGEIIRANNALEEMRKRKKDIFLPAQKGNANIFAVGGDWFMCGSKKGFHTNPNKPFAVFQLEIFNEFINQLKKIAINTKSVFLIGNHEFDGGVELLDNVLSQIDADVIASNLDIEDSPAFSKTKDSGKLFNERIIEVEDDKDPKLTHKVLFLGVLPVNLPMYAKDLNGVTLKETSHKNLASMRKEDYQQTLELCKKKILDFKNENPKGIVVFMCHSGAEFSDNLAKEAPVDIIYDGHEHKDKTRIVNDKIPIYPLSLNFEKIVNTKIHINDNGDVDSVKTISFNPLSNQKKGPIYKLFKELFKKDIENEYTIKCQNPNIKTLSLDGVREGNSFLANFITDSVLEQIQKTDSSVNFFALNSSAIRHHLNVSSEPQNSYFDIRNVLKGITEDAGRIMISEISGIELAYLVKDNLEFNRENPQKNPIIHYSRLIIDRTNILKAIDEGKSLQDILPYIIDEETNKSLEADKTYKIANVEKYFNKSRNPNIQKLKNKSEYMDTTIHQLFEQYCEEEKDNLVAKCDIRIK